VPPASSPSLVSQFGEIDDDGDKRIEYPCFCRRPCMA
jgi:hypothetical protein